MQKSKGVKNPASEEAPPILRTWNQLYGLVLLHLVILIFVFYLFTRAFE